MTHTTSDGYPLPDTDAAEHPAAVEPSIDDAAQVLGTLLAREQAVGKVRA